MYCYLVSSDLFPFPSRTYPCTLPQAVQAEFVSDFSRVHCVLQTQSAGRRHYSIARTAYGKILFVGEDQEKGITEFVFVQHSLQFLTCLNNTISIIAVNDEDNALRVLEIVSPQRPDLVLPANVPHSELNVLIFDRFDVEACCHDVSDQLTSDQIRAGDLDLPMVGIVVLWRSVGQSDGNHGGHLHNLAQLQFVQDSCLPGSVKANHQDSHLFLPP